MKVAAILVGVSFTLLAMVLYGIHYIEKADKACYMQGGVRVKISSGYACVQTKVLK